MAATKQTARKGGADAESKPKSRTRAAAGKSAVKKTAKKAAKKTTAGKVAKKAVKKAAAGKTAKKAAKKTVVKKSMGMNPVKQAAPEDLAPEEIGVLIGLESPNGVKLSAFVAKQRQRLLDLRDELINSMYGVTRDSLRSGGSEGGESAGNDEADVGSDAYDRDFALSVLAKEQDALYEIEEALKRIQRGTYGVCGISGKKILQARLEAIPFARLTVECQAAWEKEHGQQRFRPSEEGGPEEGRP